MDHNNNKTWLWRKKSSEKMIVVSDKVNLSPGLNDEEIQTLLTAKAKLEKDLKISNDKLSSCLSECNTKDTIVKKHVQMAEEAMAGWENAEEKAATLKQELDLVIQRAATGEERLTHLEEALKESMQQLNFVREEQERRVHDAVMKASKEFERSEKILEDKLAETSNRNSKLVSENTNLSKALLAKEKSIEDLIRQKAQVETDINALMTRLESTEKENASLKYEVRVLEKELEIRNEEREFHRRTADASHKQHLESVKKIAKLESECQRLRLLVRKRLPGPAALAKMRSEVDLLGSVEMRRRRTKSSINGFTPDSTMDTFNKQVSFLTEQLCAVEEENNSLKEALDKKANELQVSRSMYARTASKLSQVESHRSGFELSQASMSDNGSDDKTSCGESWASALIFELENFKHGKERGSPSGKTIGASDISLMDDFAEMERLAIVSDPLETGLNKGHASEVIGKETISQGNPDSKESEKLLDASNSLSSTRKPTDKYPLIDSSCGINEDDVRHMESDVGKWILKIIELVEGITLPIKDGNLFPYKDTETSSDYAVRVFQWKTSELGVILEKFVHTCYDLLNGKSEVNSFGQELTFALDWIMNHCFSLQDVSSMKDEIKKHLDLDDVRSEGEPEVGLVSHLEVNKSFEKDKLQCAIIDENNKLKDELTNIKSAKNDLEGRLQLALDRSESLMSQLQESKKIIAHLQAEVDTFKISKEEVQKSSFLEMELERKSSRCEELEATCLELQLQLESLTKKTISNEEEEEEEEEEEKLLRTDWEITAASEKLAECQETILNLGKQLKALAAPCDSAFLDKVISTSTETTDTSLNSTTTITMTPAAQKTLMNQRSSLLDQMLAEDSAKKKDLDLKPPKLNRSEYDNNSSVLVRNGIIEPLEKILLMNGSKHKDNNVATSSLAIVPSKNRGGGSLWRKLLWRKKKSSVKQPLLSFAT